MTIFPKRNQLPTPRMNSPIPVHRVQTDTRLDENLFEHINFGDDDEAMSSQSDNCTHGSDNESSQNRSSSWDSKVSNPNPAFPASPV